MSKKPQDDDAADDDSAASLANDLKMLSEMNIDQDFNVWSEFRSSFAVAQGKRESLQSLSRSSRISRGSKASIGHSTGSRTSTTPVVLGVQNKFNASEKSIDHLEESKHSDLSHSDHGHDEPVLDVSFSTLTPGEVRDIRAWNTRLSR